MERPSHLSLDTQSRCLPCRLPYAGLAISLQCAAVFLFIYGIANHTTIRNIIPYIEVPPIQEPEAAERAIPPEPSITKTIPIEKPIWPEIRTDRPQGDGPFQRPTSNDPQPIRGIDRALASIVGTHTAPPYPPIARRIGAEGKVTLRLTVSAEGKVTAAEIVSSSGRDDLDQSAQQWIMAHWGYKPALTNGVPTVSKTLATVVFSLVNER